MNKGWGFSRQRNQKVSFHWERSLTQTKILGVLGWVFFSWAPTFSKNTSRPIRIFFLCNFSVISPPISNNFFFVAKWKSFCFKNIFLTPTICRSPRMCDLYEQNILTAIENRSLGKQTSYELIVLLKTRSISDSGSCCCFSSWLQRDNFLFLKLSIFSSYL